jgi:hypothetical protein
MAPLRHQPWDAHILNPGTYDGTKEPIMLAQNLWFLAFAEIISRTFFPVRIWFGGT